MKIDKKKHILLIKLSALGDIVQCLPCIKAVRDSYPDAHISYVVNRENRELVEGNPYLDEVMIFERSRWGKLASLPRTIKEANEFRKSLREQNFDIAIDLQGLFRSGLIAYLSGAPLRVGFADGREGSTVFYNKKVKIPSEISHATERHIYLLSGADVADNGERDFTIAVPEEAVRKIDGIFERNNLKGAPVVAINPAARWNSKRYPGKQYAAVGDMLAEQLGARIVLLGAPNEREEIAAVAKSMKNPPVNLAGETSLKELVELLKRVDLLITNDSGPMHIGAALGTKLIAIFGPTDSKKTGPYGQLENVVRDEVCEPCYRRDCKQMDCMDRIAPEQIVENARRLL